MTDGRYCRYSFGIQFYIIFSTACQQAVLYCPSICLSLWRLFYTQGPPIEIPREKLNTWKKKGSGYMALYSSSSLGSRMDRSLGRCCLFLIASQYKVIGHLNSRLKRDQYGLGGLANERMNDSSATRVTKKTPPPIPNQLDTTRLETTYLRLEFLVKL